MMQENGQNPTEKAPQPTNYIRLEILLDQTTGQVRVNGPVDNAMFCYGLLECARQTIQNYTEKKLSGQRVVPANSMPFLRH